MGCLQAKSSSIFPQEGTKKWYRYPKDTMQTPSPIEPNRDVDSGEQSSGPPSAFAGYSPFAAACPTRRVLGIIGDKWTSLVIILLAQETKRFGQLRREIEGITQKMLTQTLRKLEHNGLVSRRVYPEVPPRVEYRLTPLGRTLTEPMAVLHAWAVANVEAIEAARAASDARGPDPAYRDG